MKSPTRPRLLLASAFMMFAGAQAFGQDVTIVLPDEPSTLEACQAFENAIGRVNLGNLVETLTVRDPVSGELKPHLATSWEQLDPLTWRFDLREGVKFHDGSDFNAAAAKLAIDRSMNPDLVCSTRTKYFGDKKLEVAVVGDYAITVTTENPEPILPLVMTTHTMYVIDSVESELTREPVGTGPYRLGEWLPGQHIVLSRNEDYWGEAPEVENATFVWRVDSAVRAAMVAQGEADLAPIISPQDVTPELGTAYPNSETTRLNLDLLMPPMDDIRIRAAINFAIDRESLKVTVGPDVIDATQMFVPQISGHNPDLKVWPYDPDQARRLIENARADGVPVDTEMEFVGRIGHFPGVGELQEAIHAMLLDVGLNVRLQWYETAQKNAMQTKPFAEGRPPQIFVDQHDNNRGDAVFTVAAKYRSDAGQSRTVDPYIDYLIDYASEQPQGPGRVAAWHRALFQVDSVIPDAMLYHMVGYAAIGPRIEYAPSIQTTSEVHVYEISFK